MATLDRVNNSRSFDKIYKTIKQLLENARSNSYRAVNFAMVVTYWEIGKLIFEEEQNRKERAEYRTYLIKELSKRLTKDYGKGFNETNLKYFRQFYLAFPISHSVGDQSGNKKSHALRDKNIIRSELSWTHYRLLLKLEKKEARAFYIIEAIKNNWSTRELERQINSLLYDRIALSKDKKKVEELSIKGQVVKNPGDIIKDPYGGSPDTQISDGGVPDTVISDIRDE